MLVLISCEQNMYNYVYVDRASHNKKLTTLTEDVKVLLTNVQAWVDRVNGVEMYQGHMKEDIEKLMQSVDNLCARQRELAELVDKHEQEKKDQEKQIEELRKLLAILQRRTQAWSDAADSIESSTYAV